MPDHFARLAQDEIQERLRSGEDSRTEFVERLGDLENLAQHIVGLANAGGGHIFVGVAADGRAAGLFDTATVVRRLSTLCREAIQPPLLPLVELHVVDQQPIAVLEVRPARPPYRLADGRIFLRLGLSAEEVPLSTYLELTQATDGLHYDSMLVPTAEPDELDPELLADYFWRTRINWLDGSGRQAEALAGALIARQESQALRPTVAGLVCFAREPHRRVPGAHLIARRFIGDDPADQPIESTDLTGPLTQQIDRALEFALRHTRVPPPTPTLRGDDSPKYPRGTLRELIVNGLAHRDYRKPDPVQLDIFDHRLEVASPGGLPHPLTTASLRWRNRLPRNPLIFQYLSRLGYLKDYDSGLSRAVQWMTEYNRPEPEFEDRGAEFVVTLRWQEAS